MTSLGTHRGTFQAICLLATIIASIASSINLAVLSLLHRQWNAYLSLVTMMTFFQFLYDISFFTGLVNTGVPNLTITSNVVQLFSGLTSSLTSNLVAFIAFYVIYFKRAFNIKKHFVAMMTTVVVVAVIDVVLYIMSQADPNKFGSLTHFSVLKLYYYIKLISIVVNFVLVIWTAFLTRRMNSRAGSRSKSESSLNALSLRLFFYPIVQLISRSGCAWYEQAYGIDYHRGKGFTFDPPHTSNLQFTAQLAASLTMPIASVGYLIIFLVMQPKAYAKCRRLLGLSTPQTGKTTSVDNHVELGEEMNAHLDPQALQSQEEDEGAEDYDFEDVDDQVSLPRSAPASVDGLDHQTHRELFHVNLLHSGHVLS